jgi:hypothetical protein
VDVSDTLWLLLESEPPERAATVNVAGKNGAGVTRVRMPLLTEYALSVSTMLSAGRAATVMLMNCAVLVLSFTLVAEVRTVAAMQQAVGTVSALATTSTRAVWVPAGDAATQYTT